MSSLQDPYHVTALLVLGEEMLRQGENHNTQSLSTFYTKATFPFEIRCSL